MATQLIATAPRVQGLEIEMGKTYTIAHDGETLFAVVPDGCDFEPQLKEQEAEGHIEIDRDDLRVETGLTLTDEPRDEDEILWSGSERGWISDGGKSYRYAVRRPARGVTAIIYVDYAATELQVQQVLDYLENEVPRDPNWAGADFRIERDDATWIDCDDQIAGTILLESIRQILAGREP